MASTSLDPIGLRVAHDFCQAGGSASPQLLVERELLGLHLQVDRQPLLRVRLDLAAGRDDGLAVDPAHVP